MRVQHIDHMRQRPGQPVAVPGQRCRRLPIPRRRPLDETQETLRTSAFPSTHVKEKWAKNLYISGVCHGRTVS